MLRSVVVLWSCTCCTKPASAPIVSSVFVRNFGTFLRQVGYRSSINLLGLLKKKNTLTLVRVNGIFWVHLRERMEASWSTAVYIGFSENFFLNPSIFHIHHFFSFSDWAFQRLRKLNWPRLQFKGHWPNWD